MQFEVNGDFEIIEDYLSDTWELHYSDNVILLFSNKTLPLDDGLLFEYVGDFEIISNLIVDLNVNEEHAHGECDKEDQGQGPELQEKPKRQELQHGAVQLYSVLDRRGCQILQEEVW